MSWKRFFMSWNTTGRRTLIAAGILVGLLTAPKPFAGAADPQEESQTKIEGVWQGTLEVGAIQLRLVAEIQSGDDGKRTGTLDSPDQNAFGLPIDEVTIEERRVVFRLSRLGARFEGTWSADGKTIDGTWKQGPSSLPLVWKPGEKIAPPKRPQEPKPPYPYQEQEVLVTRQSETADNSAEVQLAGTLTLPDGQGPHPAVLLVTGSGGQDRNEELLGHKPFLVLADHLTRQGIAVLRVDDRGVGKSTGSLAKVTTEDLVGDALACLKYLRGRSEIDATRVGLLGHSEGASIAAEVAVREPELRFIVLLAGMAIPGDELLYLQANRIATAEGVAAEQIAINRELQTALITAAKSHADVATARQQIQEAVSRWREKHTAEKLTQLGLTDALVRAETERVLIPWFRYFVNYDPAKALRQVRCSVLALYGEKDLQVPPPENQGALEAALREASNPDVTVRTLPHLNHLFQACTTGSPSEYGRIEETISPEALELLATWVRERCGRN